MSKTADCTGENSINEVVGNDVGDFLIEGVKKSIRKLKLRGNQS